MMTPLNVECFRQLLRDSDYDPVKSEFLLHGFSQGFDISYQGTKTRQSRSKNIPLTVGTKTELWNKVMKEVAAGRFASPYENIPFENYIQSPIGLVPKKGNKTRLIFHLSYRFSEDESGKSLNECTPKHMCSVKYNDLDTAVHFCIDLIQEAEENAEDDERPQIFMSKTDMSNAFCVLGLKPSCFCWLVMMAENPDTKKIYFFVDKCLPFGASISCSHYQRFSNAIKHLVVYRMKRKSITNYLDDFLFLAPRKLWCDLMTEEFLHICSELNIPVAVEKTEWEMMLIVFLGILLNRKTLTLSLPMEKKDKALNLLNELMGKRKITIKQLRFNWIFELSDQSHSTRTYVHSTYLFKICKTRRKTPQASPSRKDRSRTLIQL